MGAMVRYHGSASVTLTNSESTSPEFSFRGFGGGRIYYPANVNSSTTISWWSAHVNGGTYTICLDDADAAIESTVLASRNVPIPVALFGAAWVRAVVDSGDVAAVFDFIA